HTQRAFVDHGHYDHDAGTLAARVRADFQLNRLAGGFLKETEDFVASVQFATVHRQQVLPFSDIYPRLGERSAQVWIPVLATINMPEAIAVMIDHVIRDRKSTRLNSSHV